MGPYKMFSAKSNGVFIFFSRQVIIRGGRANVRFSGRGQIVFAGWGPMASRSHKNGVNLTEV